jgi:Calcineurin-like phosphoesterase
MFDLIGDIHGHADELIQLLEALDYRKHGTTYRHPDRKVIFLGDFIDRGPQIRQVLNIVRPMVEEGHALAVIGNHEFNALAFHTPHPDHPGTFLRERSEKNTRQHCATMTQLDGGALADTLAWFRTLPMWLDLDGLRVVHACWDEKAINKIERARQENGGISTGYLALANKKGTDLYKAVETILKGKEAKLPVGLSFTDKDGHVRTEIRTKWYKSPEGHTYGSYALQSDPITCDVSLVLRQTDSSAEI